MEQLSFTQRCVVLLLRTFPLSLLRKLALGGTRSAMLVSAEMLLQGRENAAIRQLGSRELHLRLLVCLKCVLCFLYSA